MKKEVILDLDMNNNIDDYVFFEIKFNVIDDNNIEHKIKELVPLKKSESVNDLKKLIEIVVLDRVDFYNGVYAKVNSIKLKAEFVSHHDVN